jgi:hypothetical protein
MRIQLERMPAHIHLDGRCGVRQFRERLLELTLSDEAPRADDVRNDVDRYRAIHAGSHSAIIIAAYS